MTTFALPQPKPAEPEPEPVAEPTGPAMVPLAVLKLHLICDHLSSRYALGGVKLEIHNGQPHAVATDGRRMAILSWQPDGALPDAIIPQQALATALHVTKCEKHREQAEVSRSGVAVFSADEGRRTEVAAAPIEGRYPRWRDCIPDVSSGYSTVRLDVQMLRELLAVFAATGAETVTVTTPVGDHSKPVLIAATADGINGAAVVMPKDGEAAPAWVPERSDWRDKINGEKVEG